jgi:hypothetical protein
MYCKLTADSLHRYHEDYHNDKHIINFFNLVVILQLLQSKFCTSFNNH